MTNVQQITSGRGKQVKPTSSEIRESWKRIRDAASGGDLAANALLIAMSGESATGQAAVELVKLVDAVTRTGQRAEAAPIAQAEQPSSRSVRGEHSLPATEQECRDAIAEMQAASIEIERQLNMEKAKGPSDRNDERRVWFAKATAALRHTRRDQQILMRHLGDIKKRDKAAARQLHSERMINELRIVVGEDQFQQVARRVNLMD